jgi:adenylyltransferase/sulfurtransferase
MQLSANQQQRYARNILLPEIDKAGQHKLLQSSVLLVGIGGLGSPAALYLAAAGVGCLGLMDDDTVGLSNLQRQILHGTSTVGKPKTSSARSRLQELNPDVEIIEMPYRLTADNAAEIISQHDIVLDACDNFATRFLIADACHATGTPYVHAGILEFIGQVMTVIPGQTACYRCIFREHPPEDPTRQPAGVLGVLPGVIGCIQATEVIKYLLGIGELLTDALLIYDALQMSFRRVPLSRSPDCPICSERKQEKQGQLIS